MSLLNKKYLFIQGIKHGFMYLLISIAVKVVFGPINGGIYQL